LSMTKDNPTRKFNPLLYLLVRVTLVPYLILKYRIRSKNAKLFKTLKPPFLLIPNHVSMFDPPMVNIFVPHRVHFVAADTNLRTPIGKWALEKMCRVIPKTKAVSDSSTVRRMIALARKKRVICIFAEGRSTWDGVTHGIFFSTSKLIKILKVPVVVPLIRGGYLTHPRWGSSVRPGRMVIEYTKIFDRPELKKMTPEAIHERLNQAMWNDDYAYQRETGLRFNSKKGAEYLERVLYACPVCEATGKLRSEGNRFICTACGFENRWTPEGYLEPVNRPDQPTRKMPDWFQWQNEFCGRMIQKMIDKKSKDPIFTDEDVTLKRGLKMQPLENVTRGRMVLYLDRFCLTSEHEEHVFPINETHGIQVLLGNKFEFYFGSAVYKFEFSNPRCSGFKYMNAIQKIAPHKTELE